MTLTDGGTVVATADVVGGKATFSLPGLAPGRYAFTAVYSGDALTLGSDTTVRATVR